MSFPNRPADPLQIAKRPLSGRSECSNHALDEQPFPRHEPATQTIPTQRRRRMTGFDLCQFQQEHLPAGVELSASVGWRHQLGDWEMLLSFSEGTVAQHEGRIVGTALRSDFGPDLSTLNMVIISEDQRGKGLARALISALTSDTNRLIRLVSTRSGKPLYEKLGFRDVAVLAQHQGIVAELPDIAGSRDAEPEDLPGILDLESQSFGGDRSALVDWLASNTRISVVRRKGEITGYAACRRFGLGHVIGPVVAETMQDAQAVIAHHLRDLIDHFVRLDTLQNSGLSPWLTGLGLALVDTPPIMEQGPTSMSPQRMVLFSQALV